MATTQTLIACHECDLLHRVQSLPEKSKARCSRCGSLLYVHYPETIDRTLACAITGLVLLVIANLYPFLSLESQGSILETTLITGTIILSQESMAGVAILVLFTSMLIPCVLLGALVYVLWPMKRGACLPASRRIFRLALILRPWSMTEVFLLGILVSVVKLAKMATIIPGTALFAFLALVFVLAAVNVFLDPRTIWERMDGWR
ncbi:MAG: paraquat-inducible protein A [Desulfosarcina sp.]|nr:paraquat-inducible protein A [Desulfosarcina sp.]MBC2744442.1 paraquat-inducible protein A [Desulfosarcina sp.]MBC2767350.1 paraquat-inducible protein A [Desulfosarcina sp.]